MWCIKDALWSFTWIDIFLLAGTLLLFLLCVCWCIFLNFLTCCRHQLSINQWQKCLPSSHFFSLNVLDSFPRLLSWCLSPSHLRFELRRRGRDTRREQSRQQAFYSRRPIIRLPHCFTCSCACKRSWKLKKVTDRSSSLPQKTLLLVNALSVVLSLYLWLCYITLHHHVTHLNK